MGRSASMKYWPGLFGPALLCRAEIQTPKGSVSPFASPNEVRRGSRGATPNPQNGSERLQGSL
jgi:hypothetical protein